MSPRLIRLRPASSVTLSQELRSFLNPCQDHRLKNKADEAFTELKGNYEAGVKVTKDLWPKYYRKRWGINNLYVMKLGRDWRLTYSIVSGEAAGVDVGNTHDVVAAQVGIEGGARAPIAGER